MLNVIPQPQKVQYKKDSKIEKKSKLQFKKMIINQGISLFFPEKETRINHLITSVFTGIEIEENISKTNEGYLLKLSKDHKNKETIEEEILDKLSNQEEGYYLSTDNNQIIIFSNYAQGLFYGIQTLRQIIESNKMIPAVEIIDWPDTKIRAMQYDLRLLYPKFEKLLEYIEEFAKFKTNTLLIEYEDKMPFENYSELNHPEYTFSKDEFELLKKKAEENFIEIIPLQQTFGHLEYVLKHDKYKHLMETEKAIGELCPSREESFELVSGLLEEMIENHPKSRYVHLGCDEVWYLCKCDLCQSKNNGSRVKTFISYVNKLIDFTIKKGKKPIIWHDMLDKCSKEQLKLLDNRAVVMIWIYNGKNINTRVKEMTKKLQENNIEVMGAPAVRSWDKKDDQNYPVVENRIDNLKQWSKTIAEIGIDSMLSTNWATVFGMGVPYGIFETSWYLIGFSLDKYWNYNSNNSDYLERFLKLFHELELEQVEGYDFYELEDYYQIVAAEVEKAEKNKDVAELIYVMKKYEAEIDKSRTISKYIYRKELFNNQAEKISLRTKHEKTKVSLDEIRPEMKAKLSLFMPETMVEHFILSRFYIHDFLEKNLYTENNL